MINAIAYSRGAAFSIFLTFLFCISVEAYGGSEKAPMMWWPDPASGLMWTSTARGGLHWDQASEYCSTLTISGYAVWRIPTLPEVKAIAGDEEVTPGLSPRQENSPHHTYVPDPAYVQVVFRGGLQYGVGIWTSEEKDGKHGFLNYRGAYGFYKSNTKHWDTLCVRTMEPDLLAIAKQANVTSPISDLQTLKMYALLAPAHKSFLAGQYADAITEAQSTLKTYPNFAPAYYAIGISYGMLNQWDLAITNIETSLKLDKNYQNSKDALGWAKEGQKNFNKSGKKPNAPEWN